jgi:hypothetical protein
MILSMHRITAICVAICLSSISPSVAATESKYDAEARRAYKLPDNLFRCNASDECTTIWRPCQYEIAVNKKYAAEAVRAIPPVPCMDDAPPTFSATCDAGECVIVAK